MQKSTCLHFHIRGCSSALQRRLGGIRGPLRGLPARPEGSAGREVEDHTAALKRLEEQLARVERECASLIDLAVRKLISDEELIDRRQRYTDEAGVLRERVTELKSKYPAGAVKAAIRVIELPQAIDSKWATGSASERREILRLVVSNCSVIDGSFCLTMKRPFALLHKGPFHGDGGAD